MRIVFKDNTCLVKCFKYINIVLVVGFVGLALAGFVLDESKKSIHIAALCVLIAFFVFNLLAFCLDYFPKRNIAKKIINFKTDKKYCEAKNYINKLSQKKRVLSTNQVLQYHLGHIELLEDNIEDGQYYLTQINCTKWRPITATVVTFTLFLLYFLQLYIGNQNEIECIDAIYSKNIDDLLVTTKKDVRINLLQESLISYKKGETKESIEKLKCSCFANIPYIQRFICDTQKSEVNS